MKIKRTHWISLYCTTCFCLLFTGLLRAYQVADGSPVAAPTAAKYIFYWGKFQCDLSPTTNYTGKFTCTAAAFRQMLHSTPYLWTGAGMAGQITFKLEGIPVTATRSGQDYPAMIGQLDEAIGQKVNAGQVLQLTELQLDAQTPGRIEFHIETAGQAPAGSGPYTAANMLNTRFLNLVIWGREDIYDNSNRDFFSQTEFWQTVKQLPVLEWAPYARPQPVRAGIRLYELGETPLDLRAGLDPAEYHAMLKNLENYRHLLKPGAAVSLTLHSAAQHEQLYEKTMYIVGDADPRLALRRNRDTHSLKIRWGAWEQTLPGLYLLELKDAESNTIVVDPPIELIGRVTASERPAMLSGRPEFWIDGQPVPDMVFRLTTPLDSAVVKPGQPLPQGVFAHPDSTDNAFMVQFDIDALSAPGYSLPDIHFSLRYYTLRENGRLRNSLDALRVAPGTDLAKLHTPVAAGAGYAVDLEFLQETDAKLSVFSETGETVFTLDNKYPPGRHTVELPRLVFRRPGRYFLFLNTALGVARQELVLE